MTRSLLPALLFLCIGCSSDLAKPRAFNTKYLNLNGNIKHVTENSGYNIWDIGFVDNRISAVYHNTAATRDRRPYKLVYQDSVLKEITTGGRAATPEDFEFDFNQRMPLYNFQDADTLERNKQGDVVRVVMRNTLVYRIEYTYDSMNNWTTRDVFVQDSSQAVEQTQRTILYSYEIHPAEVTMWHLRLDSIFSAMSTRSVPVLSIDTTIQNDRKRMVTLNRLVKNKYGEVTSAESRVEVLSKNFDVKYGHEDLGRELKRIQSKIRLLRSLSQAHRILWSEASFYLPRLISGEKTVHSLQEPFTDRYILTLTEQLIALIRRNEKQYNRFRENPSATETEVEQPESPVELDIIE